MSTDNETFENFNNSIKKVFPEFEEIATGQGGRVANFIQQQMENTLNTPVFLYPDNKTPMEAFLAVKDKTND